MMPNYVAEFDTGETATIWALNIESAADEIYLEFGYHPETIKENA